jgi:hypothetical protein
MMIIMVMIMMVMMSILISMMSMVMMMMISIMMMVIKSSSYLKVLMEDTNVHHGIMKRQVDSEARALVLVSGDSEVDGKSVTR